MSTILNALKRAEQDCPTQGEKNRAALRLNPGTNLNSKQRPGRFFVRFKWPAIALGCIFAAAVIFFSNTLYFQPDPSAQKAVPPKASMARPDLKVPNLKVSGLKTRDPGPEPASSKPQPKAAAPRASSKKQLLSKPEGKAVLSPPVKQPVQPDTSQKTIEAAPDNTERPNRPAVMPLDEGILKLQAISWSMDPLDRIAVINNRVMREGESVQGYRVLTIRQDQVILQHSNQNYALGFKYR